MDILIKNNWDEQGGLKSSEDANGKVFYMGCTGPETICYSREDLQNFKDQDAYLAALNELRDWLRKHAGRADLADLHEAISAAMGQKIKI